MPIRYSDDLDATSINTVVIIGLGQLGLPVAKYVKEHGFDTYGYDINQKTMQSAETNYGIKQATNFSDFDVLIICVSTHRPDDMFTPQVDGLMSVVEKISREAKTGALISIESTIPKGTSKKVFEKVDHRLHVVHTPHRWYALEEEIHGVNQLRIVGGVSNCCLQHGLNFYDGREVITPQKQQQQLKQQKQQQQNTDTTIAIATTTSRQQQMEGKKSINSNASSFLC